MSISLKFLDHAGPEGPTDAAMETVIKKSDLTLQRAAAVEFASGLIDCPMGASPASIVNHAIATYFVHGRAFDPKHLKSVGKGLKALTKMGVLWNQELIPLHLIEPMGLPKPKLVENALHVVGPLMAQVCEAREPKHSVALRAEVWNGRSGRLKLVLNGHQEVGYCHRPGPKGTWTIYQDIGENSKKLADSVETKELLKVVKKLFGGDTPEKVVVEQTADLANAGIGAIAQVSSGSDFDERRLTVLRMADGWHTINDFRTTPAPTGTIGDKVDVTNMRVDAMIQSERGKLAHIFDFATMPEGTVIMTSVGSEYTKLPGTKWAVTKASKNAPSTTVKEVEYYHFDKAKATIKTMGTDAIAEGPVMQALGNAAKTVGSIAADAGKLAFSKFADRAASRSAVARTAVDAVRGTMSRDPLQVRANANLNGLKANTVYTVRDSQKQTPGRKSFDFVDDKGRVITSLDDKDFQQRVKDKNLETLGNTAPKVV